ncbi:MAG: hypothetical protein ACE5IY_00875 [bacterium]
MKLGKKDEPKFSIVLRAKSLVLGPVVTLGDIGHIVIPDSLQRTLLSSVKISDAPPPGETTEISMRHIMRRLKTAGFEKYLSALKGPRTIRVVTAQKEIDKAFLREALASRSGGCRWLQTHKSSGA